MFYVRLEKHGAHSDNAPTVIEQVSIRQATAVHMRRESGRRHVVQLGDAPDETSEFTVGSGSDCAYTCAFVMNENGRTIDTIR